MFSKDVTAFTFVFGFRSYPFVFPRKWNPGKLTKNNFIVYFVFLLQLWYFEHVIYLQRISMPTMVVLYYFDALLYGNWSIIYFD
jgi:hypothetical protein